MPTPNEGGDSQLRSPSQNDDDTTGQTSSAASASSVRKPAPELTARQKLLEGLDSKVSAARVKDDEYFLASGDPRAAAIAAEMRAMATTDQDDTDEGDGTPTSDGATEGADSGQDDAAVQQPAAAAPQRRAAADPLADFVVVQNGKPMFRTKVDGKEQLIPLENARQQLQKHLAADIRLQQASEVQKQLNTRAQQLQQTEAALRAREQKLSQPSAKPAADDQDLDREAAELVRSLTSESETAATAKLASVLKKVKQASSTPSIDVNAIMQAAANSAMQAVAAKEQETDLQTGFSEFTKEYPELAADEALFGIADRKTEAIAQEHPEWSPSQVMREAGKQTRDWLTTLKGGAAPGSGQPNDRQARKQNLRPMPAPRAARREVGTTQEPDQTPHMALSEIRKSRGQAS